MQTCKQCGNKQNAVGHWFCGALVGIEGDHFDNTTDAQARAAQRNQENPANWIAVEIDSATGLCQHCRPSPPKTLLTPQRIESIQAGQLKLF